jgi:adenine-specific DNA methylase
MTTVRYPKRLIEVDLPIGRISAHARREKSIRHGHICTLHIWWARRPLAACRAVICAALWPDPAPGSDDPPCPPAFVEAARTHMLEWATKHAERASAASFPRLKAIQDNPRILTEQPIELRKVLFDFIADFANWDNCTVPEFLATSRALTQAAHEALGGAPGTRPLVVDPFAGGGSIPLEALRVGADAFASDLNPVAVLLNKVVLEYVPKYGQRLADEVRKWGEWIKREAEKELAEFYPKDPDGATPIAYLWARTIQCEGPGCGAEVPLIRSLWLAKKKGRYHALRWDRDGKQGIKTDHVMVKTANGENRRVSRPMLEVFSPKALSDVEQGTSRGGAATCPLCGFTNSVESVRAQLAERNGGASDSRLMCVVTVRTGCPGRTYRLPISADARAAQRAAHQLQDAVCNRLGGVPTVPDGKLNHLRGFFNIVLYGMTTWGDLFSPRQKLTLTTLCRLVKEAGERISRQTEKGLGNAVQSCLALAVSRHADINASLAMWHNTRELITHVFGRQALPMVWDYAEANTFSEASGAFLGGVDWISRVLEQPLANVGQAEQASATEHPLPDDVADTIFTDPPYYAAIPYADLSDFFYSWLQRTVASVHPDLFGEELSPKEKECVSLSHRAAMYRYKDSAWFERMMTESCREARRVVRPSGIGVFVFANKETSGWEAMLSALTSSGWVITGSWPIDTEMGNRLRARNSAVLASSVHLVCRPRENPDGSVRTDDVGDWRDVLTEVPRRIHDWMPRLAEEGVVGADAIFACLGPALEVFSRYSRVEKANGEAVTLKEYLEQVWAAVAKEALTMIFAGADATGFEEDARLTAMWLWTLKTGTADGGDDGEAAEDDGGNDNEEGGAKKGASGGFVLEFDAARKIAQGLGVHLEKVPSIVQVKGDTAQLLPVSERVPHLFGKAAEAQQKGSVRAGPKRPKQVDLFDDLRVAEAGDRGDHALGLGDHGALSAGATVLDRVHQAMILFGANRSEAMRRFLAEDGVGRDARFWRLAQALVSLYPAGTDEKRWVEGVLARKKGLGL